MEAYKQEFIEFMVESQVLKFGEFTLKSGRKSPFFMNAGAYVTGTQLRRLGEYYAKAIHDNYGLDFDVLFGPAYKGIPLSVATTMAISELYGKDPWDFRIFINTGSGSKNYFKGGSYGFFKIARRISHPCSGYHFSASYLSGTGNPGCGHHLLALLVSG